MFGLEKQKSKQPEGKTEAKVKEEPKEDLLECPFNRVECDEGCALFMKSRSKCAVVVIAENQ